MSKRWLVSGDSESGDHYKCLKVFKKKPTEAQLKKLAHDTDGDEDEEGPGDFGSYVFLEVTEIDV